MPPARVFFWVQSLLGTGHLRRVSSLAEACVRHGMEVLIASGGPPSAILMPAKVRLAQLPPITARDAEFSALVDAKGTVVDEGTWAARRALLLRWWDEYAPDVLVTEMFPFGRRAFERELLGLLERAQTARTPVQVVSSVRDILVGKNDPKKYERMQELCLRWFDHVLVHSDEALIPFGSTCPFAGSLGTKLRYTGFVLGGSVPAPHSERRGVVVSVGGGAVGEKLLTIAREAFALTASATHPWRLIGGQNISDEVLAKLSAHPALGLIVERYRHDLPSLLASATLSVSQAGYNTVVECLATRTPMILVPFSSPTEDEQRTRARILAQRGIATLVEESSLTGRSLAGAVDRMLSQSPVSALRAELDGANVTAAFLDGLARGRHHG